MRIKYILLMTILEMKIKEYKKNTKKYCPNGFEIPDKKKAIH